MKKEALFLQNITTDDPGVQNLKYVSLYLREGEILGITGLNGGGMARLADILCGRMHPTGGNIFLFEEQVEIENERTSRSLGIAEIKDHRSVVPLMSAAENLCLPSLRKGKRFVGKKYIQVVAADMFQEYNLDVDPNETAGMLSYAKRMEIAICRALRSNAKLLICHEMGAGFSEEELSECKRLLDRVCEKGISVLLLNSDPEILLHFADRCIVFRDGMICYEEERNSIEISAMKKVMQIHAVEETSDIMVRDVSQNTYLFQDIRTAEEEVPVSFLMTSGKITRINDRSLREDFFYEAFTKEKISYGQVIVSNQKYNFEKWKKAQRKMYVLKKRFWEEGVFSELSIKENIIMGTYSKFSFRAGILSNSVLNLAVDDFCIEYQINQELLSKKPHQVKESERNKIVLWRLLFCEPDILILDNPFYAMDEELRKSLLRCMENLQKGGTAILHAENGNDATW